MFYLTARTHVKSPAKTAGLQLHIFCKLISTYTGDKIKYLSPKNWRTIGRALTFRDKLTVTVLLGVIAVSFVVWVGAFYLHFTKPVPKAGGEYIEGVVGQPLYINPLLSQTSEADSDLTQLVYAGLFKYDKSGKAVPDLAESWEVSDDQRVYTVHIKKNLTWHDGKPLDAKDAFFTFNILQDPAYKSPLRQNWQGVDVSQADDYTVVFTLRNPYIGFLDNLTVGLLPKHVWENIAPEKFALAEYNLHPVGAGPYVFSDFQKDQDGNILSLRLVAFKGYNAGTPYISKMTFDFYPEDDALLAAYNKKEIMGMGSIAPEKITDIKNAKSTQVHELVIPRYFSVFFNQTKSVALAHDEVRKALDLATDRKEVIDTVLHGKGTALSSPLFPQMEGYEQSGQAQADLQQANKILDDAGWTLDAQDNVRKKNGTPLEFELATTDWPELNDTAMILKKQWEKIGARVNVKTLTVSDLQQNYIRTREYDSLLFGQAISFNPDFYSFWHSSQKRDPGLNLSLFDDKDSDSLLEDIRQQPDQGRRVDEYKQFQQILSKEMPAIFLYSPYYLYPVNTQVGGMDAQNIDAPQQRFAGVDKWYVKTKRVFK